MGELNEKKVKKDIIPTGIESSRRTIDGLPGGDPRNGTTWKDTLILIVVLLVGGLIYLIFT